MGLTHPTQAGRTGPLQILLIEEVWLMQSRRRAFSAVAPTLWNIMLPEVRGETLSTFQKDIALPAGMGPQWGSDIMEVVNGLGVTHILPMCTCSFPLHLGQFNCNHILNFWSLLF